MIYLFKKQEYLTTTIPPLSLFLLLSLSHTHTRTPNLSSVSATIQCSRYTNFVIFIISVFESWLKLNSHITLVDVSLEFLTSYRFPFPLFPRHLFLDNTRSLTFCFPLYLRDLQSANWIPRRADAIAPLWVCGSQRARSKGGLSSVRSGHVSGQTQVQKTDIQAQAIRQGTAS